MSGCDWLTNKQMRQRQPQWTLVGERGDVSLLRAPDVAAAMKKWQRAEARERSERRQRLYYQRAAPKRRQCVHSQSTLSRLVVKRRRLYC